jgi:hypothetical protein
LKETTPEYSVAFVCRDWLGDWLSTPMVRSNDDRSQIEVQDIGTLTPLRKRKSWDVPGIMCTNLMHPDLG